jgi:hypothetical protein
MSQELEDRFESFAGSARDFCHKTKWDVINLEHLRLIKASSDNNIFLFLVPCAFSIIFAL